MKLQKDSQWNRRRQTRSIKKIQKEEEINIEIEGFYLDFLSPFAPAFTIAILEGFSSGKRRAKGKENLKTPLLIKKDQHLPVSTHPNALSGSMHYLPLF